MIVSLPMYDLPEVRDLLDVLWRGVRRRLVKTDIARVPDALVHECPVHELWCSPDLLLSQCCGYDIVNRYAGTLVPLATPRYTAPGCRGCEYASVVLVGAHSPATRMEDLRGALCVVNGMESHSGANALRALVAPLSRDGRFFGHVMTSGSHVDSVAALAAGWADVTAVDAVTYALLERYRPDAVADTRALCYTPRAPGVPFVTRAAARPALRAALQRALLEACADNEVRGACRALFMDGVEILAASAYQQLVQLERKAAAQGYPALR